MDHHFTLYMKMLNSFHSKMVPMRSLPVSKSWRDTDFPDTAYCAYCVHTHFFYLNNFKNPIFSTHLASKLFALIVARDKVGGRPF